MKYLLRATNNQHNFYIFIMQIVTSSRLIQMYFCQMPNQKFFTSKMETD